MLSRKAATPRTMIEKTSAAAGRQGGWTDGSGTSQSTMKRLLDKLTEDASSDHVEETRHVDELRTGELVKVLAGCAEGRFDEDGASSVVR